MAKAKTAKQYEAELRRMIKSRTGADCEAWLTPQVRTTAMNMVMLDKVQGELSDIENKLAAVRRYFNSATRELNNAVQTFPANLLAGLFGFHKEAMYEIEASQRAAVEKAPEIQF